MGFISLFSLKYIEARSIVPANGLSSRKRNDEGSRLMLCTFPVDYSGAYFCVNLHEGPAKLVEISQMKIVMSKYCLGRDQTFYFLILK